MDQAESPVGYARSDETASRASGRDETEAGTPAPKPGAKIKWGYGNLTIQWSYPGLRQELEESDSR